MPEKNKYIYKYIFVKGILFFYFSKSLNCILQNGKNTFAHFVVLYKHISLYFILPYLYRYSVYQTVYVLTNFIYLNMYGSLKLLSHCVVNYISFF